MSKKLWILTAVLAVSLGGFAFAAVENIKVSGDVTVYGVNRVNYDLGFTNPDSPVNNDRLDDSIVVLAQVSNLKFEADLTEDVLAAIGLRDERIWGGTNSLYASSAYVTLKQFFSMPLTLKLGVQPLRVGSGLLVADPDTDQTTAAGTPFGSGDGNIGDLSPRKAFQGIVGTIDLADIVPATLTLGYVKASEGTASQEDDTNAYVADFNYNFTDTTKGELYFAQKNTQENSAGDITEDDVSNVGARVVSSVIDNLTLSVEGCYQTGKEELGTTGARDDLKDRSDWATLASLQYAFPDITGTPALGVDFTRVSENWDPMWEGLNPADIANALFTISNTQVVGTSLSAKPYEDLSLKLRYANFRLVEEKSSLANADFAPGLTAATSSYTLDDKKQLGNEIDVVCGYDYTEDVNLGLNLGWFIPGSAFNEVNDSTAFQALGTMKVSF